MYSSNITQIYTFDTLTLSMTCTLAMYFRTEPTMPKKASSLNGGMRVTEIGIIKPNCVSKPHGRLFN